MGRFVEPIYLEPEPDKKQKITDYCLNCYFYRGQNSYQKCIALSNTDFGERKCPFHKTDREQADSVQRAKERLLRIGFKKKAIDDWFFR